MEPTIQKYLQFVCYSLAKTTCATVRLYRKENSIYYYSANHLHPDPAEPYLQELLNENQQASVFVTPLHQFYGYLTVKDEWRIIIGPSRIDNHDSRLIEEQMLMLNIEPGKKMNYINALNCCPITSLKRMKWLVAFLSTVLEKRILSTENVNINIKPEEHLSDVQTNYAQTQTQHWRTNPQTLYKQVYQYEKLAMTYIQQGKPIQARELLNLLPSILVARMNSNNLRYQKNTAICAATISSRAAIAGGMESSTALQMAALFVEKIELLQDVSALIKLKNDIIVSFAEEVHKIRYQVAPSSNESCDSLFSACAEYVTQNIYDPIRPRDMAQALGYNRSYLSSRFKQQTGITLTQYILQEKIFESQRILEFTDKSLLDIANLFSFSSQSHFQNAFKKLTGETPMAYRRRVTKKK